MMPRRSFHRHRLFIAFFWIAGLAPRTGPAWDLDWSLATELHPGIEWFQKKTSTPRNLEINFLRVDSHHPMIRFHTTPRIEDWVENNRETQRQTTLDYMRETRSNGIPLVAGINADAWSPFPAPISTPVNLRGLAVSDGVLVSPANGSPSLLVRNDGLLTMQQTSIATDIADIHTAVSGFQFALVAGNPVNSGISLEPRTGYGLSEDGRYLILMTIDGRRWSSQGATVSEVGSWLLFAGAHTGINVDGGGSTTMAWWDPAIDDATLLNVPNTIAFDFDPNDPEGSLESERLAFEFGLLPNLRANGNHLGIYIVPEPSSLLLIASALLLWIIAVVRRVDPRTVGPRRTARP